MAERGERLSKDLLKLIHMYQLHVLGCVQAFQRRFGVDDFTGTWQRGEVPGHQTGALRRT